MKDKPLTAKQQRFCEEYQVDLNATQAAIRAGYAAKSINTERICNIIGSQNLAKISIKKEITKGMAETKAKSVATREQRQRFWSRVMQGLVDGKYTMADKLRASELLGKSECDFVEKSINLNVDIPTEPEQYKSWLRNELERLEGSNEVIESYANSQSAIAKRY